MDSIFGFSQGGVCSGTITYSSQKQASYGRAICQFCATIFTLALLAGLGVSSRADVLIDAGMKITSATRFKAGVYRLAGNENGTIQITGRGYTLDFAGVKLRGEGKNAGIGIAIRDAREITIKNADVRGMRWGILIERCTNIRLENCRFEANGNLPYGTVIDESGNQPEDQHGGGILIRDSDKCRVVKCKATHQWDGIDVVRSNDNIIEQGDFSYNNNWGVHLWASSRNRFLDNKAIWCTSGASLVYQSLSGWQTYDAQAVAIDHNSHENRIEGNDLRFGGDGIFIRANEGALYPDSGIMTPVKNGSHRNILKNNDCSFSPNNAIEVDFVDDTVIEGNNCSNSNYGMWLGYSRRSLVSKNLILNCSSKAIEIENGQGSVFEQNVIGNLPAKPAQPLIYLRQNGRDKTPSGGYVIRQNQFIGAGQAVVLRNTGAIVQDNVLTEMKEDKTVAADGNSQVQETGTKRIAFTGDDPKKTRGNLSAVLISFGKTTYSLPKGNQEVPAGLPTFALVNGIPMLGEQAKSGTIAINIPEEWGNLPVPTRVESVVYFRGGSSFPLRNPLSSNPLAVRILKLEPLAAKAGDWVTATGRNLGAAQIFVNGVPVPSEKGIADAIRFRVPSSFVKAMRVHVVAVLSVDEESRQSAPIVLEIIR